MAQAGAGFRPAATPRRHASARRWARCVVPGVSAYAAGTLLLRFVADATGRHGVLLVADLAAGAMACAALCLRRRNPVVVAFLTQAAATSAISGLPAAAVALVTLAMLRPWRTALLLVTAVTAVIAGVTAAVFGGGGEPWPAQAGTAALSGLLSMMPLVAVGMVLRARHDVVDSLQRGIVRSEADQRSLEHRARLAERAIVAREMHDVLAHRLSLVAMHAGALEYRPDVPHQDLARAAWVIDDNVRRARDELQEVTHVLDGSSGTAGPGYPSAASPTQVELEDLMAESHSAGVEVHVDQRGPSLDTLSRETARTVYRVVQEGLTNARKHSPGSRVAVSIAATRDAGVSVSVSNGPAPRLAEGLPGTGTGLIGITERVTLAGGRLRHGTLPAGGFLVEAWLP